MKITSAARQSWFLLAGALLLTAGLACGPKISPEEMGDVVFEVPDISGAEEPFPLPQLEGAESPKKVDSGDAEVGMTDTVADDAPAAREKAAGDPAASDREALPAGDTKPAADAADASE